MCHAIKTCEKEKKTASSEPTRYPEEKNLGRENCKDVEELQRA